MSTSTTGLTTFRRPSSIYSPQETGIPMEKIVYDIFEDPAEPFAKLEAGGSGYYVMVLPDNDAGLAIRRRCVRGAR